MINNHLGGTAYLVFRKDRFGIRVVKATQKKPAVVDADCIVVKIRINVPAAAFDPFEPEAVLTIPDELIQHPVHVEAEDGSA